MKRYLKTWAWALALLFLAMACGGSGQQNAKDPANNGTAKQEEGFQVVTDRFADLQILRYQVEGFDQLSLQQKELVYYLYKAALSGRDVIWDQNHKHNLLVRRAIEAIVETYSGNKEGTEWQAFMTWAKRVWFSNGIHHHYSTAKMAPGFTAAYWQTLLEGANPERLKEKTGHDAAYLVQATTNLLMDPTVDAKRVNQASGIDMVQGSANNLYQNVTQAEVESFYAAMANPDNPRPVSYGLNSQLVKEGNQLVEKTYKVGGMYGAALEEVARWLEKAAAVAENDAQRKALEALVQYYKTGDLADFDAYNIAWVADTASVVDVVNGFIEVYGDPMGMRGAFESVVSIKDMAATARMDALAKEAAWFEQNAPFLEEHKKKEVAGISYKVITVVVESGDAAPSTPIGINLPNSQWIRKEHGSKSVSLGNIKNAYNQASAGGAVQEFYKGQEVQNMVSTHSVLASNLHTAMHEVIGHASGQLEPGVKGPAETLKNYASPLEEARADLVSLYYIMDPKLMEIGVMPTLDVGKAEYNTYITNGLMLQLRRLNEGDDIEQAHMRNRQMVSAWVYQKGQANNVIEKVVENGKTYFVINDYQALRQLFGQLLKEVQRIKSQGDYEAGKALIENYGVKVDQDLLRQVKQRFESMNSAPYSGFIQPKLVAKEENGKITNVSIEYPKDFVAQMLEYGNEYSFLPNDN